MKGVDQSLIVGYWAEDGNEFLITVPPQLRDQIVELQNLLASSYLELEMAEEKLRAIRHNHLRIFGDPNKPALPGEPV
jgi:hypothetical protein